MAAGCSGGGKLLFFFFLSNALAAAQNKRRRLIKSWLIRGLAASNVPQLAFNEAVRINSAKAVYPCEAAAARQERHVAARETMILLLGFVGNLDVRLASCVALG